MVQPKGKARDVADTVLNRNRKSQDKRNKKDLKKEMAFMRDMSSRGYSRFR